MTFDQAARILGVKLSNDLTENAVRTAFSNAVKLSHPDVGGGVGNRSMGDLTKAKDVLLRFVGEDELTVKPIPIPPTVKMRRV